MMFDGIWELRGVSPGSEERAVAFQTGGTMNKALGCRQLDDLMTSVRAGVSFVSQMQEALSMAQQGLGLFKEGRGQFRPRADGRQRPRPLHATVVFLCF